MKSYLYVMVDNIPVLMHGESVHEILPLSGEISDCHSKNSSVSGHMEWRDQVLPIVNVRNLLNLPASISTSPNAGVVYRNSESDSSVFLVVDEVVKILTLGMQSFVPLPHVPEKISSFFDRVYVDEAEMRQVYRFRDSFPAY